MDLNKETLKKDWEETKDDVAAGYDEAVGKAHELGHDAKEEAEKIGREAKDKIHQETGR